MRQQPVIPFHIAIGLRGSDGVYAVRATTRGAETTTELELPESLLALAESWIIAGGLENAEALFGEAVDLGQNYGLYRSRYEGLNGQGIAALLRHDLARARSCIEAAATVARDTTELNSSLPWSDVLMAAIAAIAAAAKHSVMRVTIRMLRFLTESAKRNNGQGLASQPMATTTPAARAAMESLVTSHDRGRVSSR